MKKFTVTILAIVYLAVSSGAVVHMHYCMGKLVSSGLWHSKVNKETCPVCGMTKKKGCCEDKHKIIKLDKQYDAKQPSVSADKIISPIHNSYVSFDVKYAFLISGCSFTNTSPPGISHVPLYITNCVYRI